MKRLRLTLIAAVMSAMLVVSGAGTEPEASSTRTPDSILSAPIYHQATAEAYARSVGSTRYIMEAIPYYYRLAPKVGIAPDVLVAQAIHETGRGHYGGDSKPWNMAGIKKGGVVGDEPEDFEVPPNAYEGVRMHVNHMAAYTGKEPIGTPHDRYYDARAAQSNRGWWVTKVSQLGGGIWATDPDYADKLHLILDDMDEYANGSEKSTQVVDNTTVGRFAASGNVWGTSYYGSQKTGQNYRFTRPSSGVDYAWYKVKRPTRGRYAIFGWWPANSGYNDRTQYWIYTVDGWAGKKVNQRINGGKWNYLGTYTMNAGDDWAIAVSNRSAGRGYIIADAVAIQH